MLLAIDVGNTNISFGVFEGEVLLHHVRCESARSRTSDEYAVLVRQMLDAARRRPRRHRQRDHRERRADAHRTRWWGSCAAGVRRSRRSWWARASRPGMAILYENPREVGADRIVNAVAAHEWVRGGAGGGGG